MTADKLQRIVCTLANGSWCRYWLNFNESSKDVVMAVQCIDFMGKPIPINDAKRFGFTENAALVYTIARTNEDGTPYESKLL